ncbi:MAG: DUF4357 domain-containing protein, partial [Candidatus Methanoplasma sp.]|nr:DUF4357 domain-containing protein [Candidatus Methanoplasma sp.]
NKPLSDQPIDAILLFHKQNYDYSKVREHAEFNINKDKIQSSVDAFLSCFLSGSDREIYGEILKDAKVHDGPITRYLIDKYSSVISEAVNNYIGQKISIQSSNETVPEVVKPCSSDELYHIKGWKDPDQAYLKVLGPKQFVVVRGSFLNKLSPNCEKAKNQRQEHLAKISSGRLTQDVELSTASAAGMLAYGTNVNGWVVWVNDNDSPLKKARPDLYI